MVEKQQRCAWCVVRSVSVYESHYSDTSDTVGAISCWKRVSAKPVQSVGNYIHCVRLHDGVPDTCTGHSSELRTVSG